MRTTQWAAIGALGATTAVGGALAVGTAEAADEGETRADVIAVDVHADWCGHCQTISERVPDVIAQVGREDVLFVTFDITNETTRHQSALLASRLGLESLYAAEGDRQGRVLLVDADTHEIVGTITSRDDVAAMTRKVRAAL